MAAILYTLLFLMGGLMIVCCQLPAKSPLVRAFLGLALGVLLEMQMPALCAYALGFTLKAHYAAACLLLAVVGAAYALRDRRALRPLSEAIITRGGIDVKALQPSTMAVRSLQGLYAAGELIDVDAHTGGYNLQIAFATGALAGQSAAAYLCSLC